VLVVPDAHDEGVQPEILVLDAQLGEDYCVVADQAQLARPPLGAADGRGVDDELLAGDVVIGSRLQVDDVRAVGQLGLRVAPHDLQVYRRL
jgi:hypothetical protein